MRFLMSLAAVGLLSTPAPDRFTIAGELQAVYDELGQATLSAQTAADVDDFHDVFCTPDWTFTDRAGVRHAWPEVREELVRAASERRYDAMRDVIQSLSLTGDIAATSVHAITVRTVIDREGKYGAAGATHTIAEVTPMNDRWLRTPAGWKLQARTRTGDPRPLVDKLPDELDSPKAPSVKS